jgi:hypothetical protein
MNLGHGNPAHLSDRYPGFSTLLPKVSYFPRSAGRTESQSELEAIATSRRGINGTIGHSEKDQFLLAGRGMELPHAR